VVDFFVGGRHGAFSRLWQKCQCAARTGAGLELRQAEAALARARERLKQIVANFGCDSRAGILDTLSGLAYFTAAQTFPLR
jgi:hypothetical protein